MKNMMKSASIAIAAILLGGGPGLNADEEPLQQAPKLSTENQKLRDLVLPSESEASFRTIRWRTSVLQGIVDAQKEDKPVMIYLMNGHPLACT